jgi:16S rRNA G527 N7-methylase RsmG
VRNLDRMNESVIQNAGYCLSNPSCGSADYDYVAAECDDTTEISIKKYVRLLMDYNVKVNLISRKMTPEGLDQLLKETILLNSHISETIDTIVDAGSGNGILGIPIAVINKNKNNRIILVEPKKKKIDFLLEVKDQMDLSNVEIYGSSIKEYLKKKNSEKKPISLVTRGFPNLKVLSNFIKKGMIEEVIMITSENKIKKNRNYLESVKKKTYNVPLRDHLKILKMEKTVRE